MSRFDRYTKCVNCEHAIEVFEPDRFGVKHPSMEVFQCHVFQQFRCARTIRACAEFKLKKEAA